ncbi:MAG: ATP phosphoribosyltransferase regulatory subunit, partial [Deltaproteobacteria bacterium]|nr:ATP phosphoribosyltransferase regulatory subunit [Deltaproteobacteria bacterium]
EAAGYGEVIPPLLERAEVFETPGALRAVDHSGHLLGLRADFTAQVARIAATRLSNVSPLKLYYRGPVVREGAGEAELRERLQAGCELVGAPEVDADAEIVSLAAQSLRALGIPADQARVSIGAVGWFAAIVEQAQLPARLVRTLTEAIDRKDAPRLTQLCERELLGHEARDALLLLTRPPATSADAAQLLDRARSLSQAPAARAALDRLAALVDAARARGFAESLELDLGEVRGLGYYTGLVFNLYAAGAPRAVGGGGRYDQLLGRFGDSRPAVGFSLDLDALVPLAKPEEPC